MSASLGLSALQQILWRNSGRSRKTDSEKEGAGRLTSSPGKDSVDSADSVGAEFTELRNLGCVVAMSMPQDFAR